METESATLAPPKRKRITARRIQLLRDLKSRALHIFETAMKNGTGVSDAFNECVEIRRSADLTPSQGEEFSSYLWGVRDFIHRTEPHWQLFLDGQAMTGDQISDLRAAGDEGVWERVKGLMVWKRHLPEFKAFYTTGEEPHRF